MSDTPKLTQEYFQAANNYFWRWAEKGTLLEWRDGRTICYREDLVQLLRQLEPTGLPPLGTILLVLSACQDRWGETSIDSQKILGRVGIYIINTIAPKTAKVTNQSVKGAMRAMNMIHNLKKDFRQGNRRILLLQEIARHTQYRIQPAAARAIIDYFETGNLDERIFKELYLLQAHRLPMDLQALEQFVRQYKNTEQLQLKLMTGVQQLPAPLTDLELPEESPPRDLLEELSQDQKTVGLAQLTQRLIAALHIPMHLQGRSDQSLGGYSDISNRGDFDKLLISELAYDELSLTARLVNNEALFLHHESPPTPLTQQRMILLDSTIKMWGYPRIFALAAALACSHQQREQLTIEAKSLGGEEVQPVDLQNKAGVLKALQQLDASLDCSPALEQVFQQNASSTAQEVILITHEKSLDSPAFQMQLSHYKQQLDYLITVNRSGALQFFRWVSGRRKLLRTAHFDLPQLLLRSKVAQQSPHKVSGDLPLFYLQQTWPLLLPTNDIRAQWRNTTNLGDFGIVGINDMQRLLYWPIPQKGAIELTPYIEYAKEYHFGLKFPKLYILVDINGTTQFKLYEVDLIERHTQPYEFERKLRNVVKAVFHDDIFYVHADYSIFGIHCQTKRIEPKILNREKFEIFYKNHHTRSFNPKMIKKTINNGFSTLKRVHQIFISQEGHIALDDREIKVTKAKHLCIIKRASGRDTTIPTPQYPLTFADPDNTQLVFLKARWPNGSELIIDPRGLLHLQSHSSELPAVTLSLILGRTLSAWSSDGYSAGSPYFVPKDHKGPRMTTTQFYETKIQAFINALAE
ncbi:MAG: hypothetical protein AAGG75_00170 [Bacteroidota bacterium]